MKQLAKNIIKKVITINKQIPLPLIGGIFIFSGITINFFKNYRVKITIKKKWKKGDPYFSIFDEYETKNKEKKKKKDGKK